ncbi:MAG TPA: CYTH and CHAD domain-containing protein [Gaiellaceae bacterium]|jgi:CHAD domain-containing protein|nr:CYTH and CHAD domain-containing protein [Gaiellaceae bacterium]
MERLLERELKLDPDAGFHLPDLPGTALEPRVFTSTYVDTPPRSLARAGITLRRRLENGRSRWQLKLPRAEGRAELESAGGPAGPPAELRDLLTVHLRHGPLEPVATLRTRRSGVRVTDGPRPLADVTVDTVDVVDGGRASQGFVELEVELVEGDDHDLERLGRLLRRAGAQRSDGRPKLLRVLDLPPEADLAAGAPASARLQALLAAQLAAIERYDPGARHGDDPEDVHRLRVATRRSRALIDVTKPVLGEALAPLAGELRWLAGLLGDVRDLDVLIERLLGEAETLDEDAAGAATIVAALVEERDRAREALLAGLSSERYLALLTSFEESVALLPELDVDGGWKPTAAQALKRLARDARKLPDEPADDELHDLRKRAKKARYAGELAALGGSRAVARYVDALKVVQDAIGEHQDAVVAEERLRALARARTAIATGRLIERERARRAAARAGYRSLLDAALSAGRKAL